MILVPLVLSPVTSRGAGASIPFAPTDLPNLELWLDANGGVNNALGNYFTDETRGFELAGFPLSNDVDPNSASYYVYGETNGRTRYQSNNLSGGDYGGQGSVFWNGSAWQLQVEIYYEEGSSFALNSTATGDTEYPWQATWPAGTTVNPQATTVDVPATNNETVEQWNNKVSGKPNLSQDTEGSRPIFKSNVNGRKAVSFNGDALYNYNFSTFGVQYSYYLVANTLGGSGSGSDLRTAIKLGTSTLVSRGRLGATITTIAASNGTLKNSTINKTSSGCVWSARFNVSIGQVTVGSNLTSEILTGIGTSSAVQSTIVIGALDTSGSSAPIVSDFSEVLVYKAYHDEVTANQVINYLIQKWNISV